MTEKNEFQISLYLIYMHIWSMQEMFNLQKNIPFNVSFC